MSPQKTVYKAEDWDGRKTYSAERLPLMVHPDVRIRLRNHLMSKGAPRGMGYSEFIDAAIDAEQGKTITEAALKTLMDERYGVNVEAEAQAIVEGAREIAAETFGKTLTPFEEVIARTTYAFVAETYEQRRRELIDDLAAFISDLRVRFDPPGYLTDEEHEKAQAQHEAANLAADEIEGILHEAAKPKPLDVQRHTR